MAWITYADVKYVLGYPTTSPPVADATITALIPYAQAEVEAIANTKFLYVEDSGTASAGGATTLTDSTKAWTVDSWNNYYAVYIYDGTGEGQIRTIIDSTATALTVDAAWTTAPDNTSKYKIIQDTRIQESVDGSGNDTFYLSNYPLFVLRTLIIDDTSITVSYVHQYKESGKLVLGSSAEASNFTFTEPQQIDLDYYYGYHTTKNSTGIPVEVKELCIIIAALKTLYNQIAATYDDITSFSLPHMSGTTGEPYMNVKAAVAELEKRKLELIKLIPKYRSI